MIGFSEAEGLQDMEHFLFLCSCHGTLLLGCLSHWGCGVEAGLLACLLQLTPQLLFVASVSVEELTNMSDGGSFILLSVLRLGLMSARSISIIHKHFKLQIIPLKTTQ